MCFHLIHLMCSTISFGVRLSSRHHARTLVNRAPERVAVFKELRAQWNIDASLTGFTINCCRRNSIVTNVWLSLNSESNDMKCLISVLLDMQCSQRNLWSPLDGQAGVEHDSPPPFQMQCVYLSLSLDRTGYFRGPLTFNHLYSGPKSGPSAFF